MWRTPVEFVSENVQTQPNKSKEAEARFESVFLQNYARVYGLLFRLLGDRAEAEDLTLETFWKFWERPPVRHDNIVGWLCRVAINLGYNALRAANRRTWYETEAGRDAIEVNSLPDPAHEAERNADRRRARATLQRMAPREAQILLLRHSGFAYKEIAEAIGVAPSSVGTLLARAEDEFERLYDDTSD